LSLGCLDARAIGLATGTFGRSAVIPNRPGSDQIAHLVGGAGRPRLQEEITVQRVTEQRIRANVAVDSFLAREIARPITACIAEQIATRYGTISTRNCLSLAAEGDNGVRHVCEGASSNQVDTSAIRRGILGNCTRGNSRAGMTAEDPTSVCAGAILRDRAPYDG